MKSVLVANEFTNVADPTTLTSGQLACYKADGTPIVSATTIKHSDMVKFVVGLGNGKTKEGVWINPNNSIFEKAEYKAATAKTIAFTNIAANIDAAFIGEEASISIVCQPKNSYNYPNKVFDAVIVLSSRNETSDTFLNRLKKEVISQVDAINAYYGYTAMNLNPSNDSMGVSLSFIGAVGFEFNVVFNGIVSATKAISGDTTSTGTYEQVSEQEKFYDVWSVGYNPNYKIGDNWYGNIFLANAAKTYNIYTISSRANYKQEFNANSEGMEVTQYIAFDSTAEVTDIEAVLSKISISNS